MSDGSQHNALHVRERAKPLRTVLHFAPDGLVLGAGTIILRAEEPRRLRTLAGQEARVLALLSAAYGQAVDRTILGNIERASKAWNQGDDCLAYIHLAHARLGELQYPHDAAQRLVIVDALLKAGGSPRAIFEALKVDSRYIDALAKDYNPAEPRIPAGSGRTRGQWTRDGGAASPSPLSYLAPGATSWLGDLAPSAATPLGEYALSLLSGSAGAAAAFGLIFIPSNKNVGVEGDVEGMPGLHYSWNPDERGIHLTYDSADGSHRVFFASLDKEDVFRDGQGRAVGRVLPGDTIALDPAAISSDLVQDDEPRLCPAPVKDRRTNDLGLDYENYIKSIVNPGNPTPPYMGYELPNLTRAVSFDDCEHSTGTMIEIKDGYTEFLESDWGRGLVATMFVKQAMDQIQTAGTRRVRWYFSQKQVADYAKKVFADNGLQDIDIIFKPWRGSKK